MSRLARPAGALWRDCGDCVVTAVPDHADLRRLNGVARMIWLALDHPATVAELAAAIDAAGQAEDAAAVQSAADELVTIGLLRSIG